MFVFIIMSTIELNLIIILKIIWHISKSYFSVFFLPPLALFTNFFRPDTLKRYSTFGPFSVIPPHVIK